MAKQNLSLRLGIMTNLEQQLDEQGLVLSPNHLEFFNKVIDSYNRLRINGFITDSETQKVGQRITKDIAKEAKPKDQ